MRDLAPFLLRVVVGLIFIMHGYQKLTMGVEGVTGFLGGLGFPMPALFAVLLIAAELGGGILLVLGVLTHWVAKILALVALVALVTVHLQNGFFLPGGYEFILLILVASISLVLTGPGRYALDKKMRKH
ncbi:MAG TPA: DoxX family protein [Candidatus Paceibacterota bacterium]|nr:DoxX family protein [Candidatus Paceibacterota bacterium]